MSQSDSPNDRSETTGIAALTDEGRQAPVHRLVADFLRALKGFRLYAPDHPVLGEFLAAFHGGLTRLLDESEQLSLRVRQSSICWGEETVYECQKREESLAFRLFIHGVREFSFHRGVPLEEVSAFLEVLHRTLSSRSSLDDLLSLLWEKDLEHITFLVLDDFLEEGDQDDYERFVAEGRIDDGGSGSLRVTVQPLLDRLLAQAMTPGASPESQRLGIFELDGRERAHLDRLIKEEGERSLLQDLCRLSLEILGQGELQGEARELVAVLESVLLNLLNEGGLEQAAWVASELSRFLGTKAGGSAQRSARSALSRLHAGRLVEALGPHLPGIRESQLATFGEFLAALGPDSIPLLLEHLDQPHSHHPAMRILARVAREHPAHLLPGLRDARARIVQGLLKILGELGDPDSLRAFPALLHHSDADVRRDALLTVKRIGTSAAFPILHEVLRGGAPEMRVLALGALEGLPPEAYRQPLLAIARSRDFPSRNYFEKREVLVALARASDPEVVRLLVSFTRRRSLFHRQGNSELRACAVTALARCAGEEAVAAIQGCLRDRDDQVRRAAVQAMGTFQTRSRQGG